MNSTSRLAEAGLDYESQGWFDSEIMPGVRYRLARVSMMRRIELAKRIRDIGRKLEFLNASSDVREKLEANVLAAEIDRTYLEWGLQEIVGLSIDGQAATPAGLIEVGPIELSTEILRCIKAQCGLNEAERKN